MTQLPFELEALANAVNYQKWIFAMAEPFLGNRILEIGAGIGNVSQWLPISERLIVSESDPILFARLEKKFSPNPNPAKFSLEFFDAIHGPTESYIEQNLDTVISFNVLEHIKNDKLALQRLCKILQKSSSPQKRRLVCFVPAHSWAFGSADQAFGHFRRYSKTSLTKLAQEVAPEAKIYIRHFNFVGLLGWIVQGKLLKRRYLSTNAIQSFEKLCPFFRFIDKLLYKFLGLPLGQSILFVLEWDS